jgi:hypothetical protein
MNKKFFFLSTFTVLLAFSTRASAEVIEADDEGSITSYSIVTPHGPMKYDVEGGANAGFDHLPVSYSTIDYFADFNSDSIGHDPIVAASFNVGIMADPTYTGVYGPHEFVELDLLYNSLTHDPETDPSQFANLASGDLIGSIRISLKRLQSDHRYHIDLNAQGIQDLEDASGEITVSGVLESVGSVSVNSFVVDLDNPKLKLSIASVPEPTEVTLLLGGLFGLALVSRNRTKHQA